MARLGRTRVAGVREHRLTGPWVLAPLPLTSPFSTAVPSDYQVDQRAGLCRIAQDRAGAAQKGMRRWLQDFSCLNVVAHPLSLSLSHTARGEPFT